jgi:hypothetical protein
MPNTLRPPSDARKLTASPAERCAELLHRVMTSQATMSSAHELPKVSDALKERVIQGHLAGESGLLAMFSQLTVPESFDPAKEIPRIAKQMAEQTAVNLEVIISAAITVLSHSTADDVFTGACELSMDLAPKDWISELNLERKISLRSLIENGSEAVLADQLRSFRGQLGSKSLPARAEIFFRHVPLQHHQSIPKRDPAYFRLSTLKEADDLRNLIVHGSRLPRIDPILSKNTMLFLHEAALVAIRSVITAYHIPFAWGDLMKFYSGNQTPTGGA